MTAGVPAAGGLTAGTLLRLGRVSNLPTVWTNALAGAALAGAADPGALPVGAVLGAALALTLFYEGGMWLNDAFDAPIDARERAGRPIPRGEVGRGVVFAGGLALLAAGVAASALLGAAAGWAGLALAAAVLLYDWSHKRTAWGPVIMGAARALSYALAALAAGGFAGLGAPMVLGALGLWAWVVGLTYAARGEAHDRLGAAWPLGALGLPILYAVWLGLGEPLALALAGGLTVAAGLALRRLRHRAPGDVPRAVVTMIAAISLYDAALIAATGATGLALLAAAGFALTLALQRVAPGT